MTKYELDHLPATTAGKRMYARVSPVYENSLFMKRFYDALGSKWNLIREYFTTLREQNYIDTVDWGIEFQEHKYSLEPRPDLSLEERRARLGIKARTQRPLNPAVLERYIRDELGLEIYLGEDEPGYIDIVANTSTDTGWAKLIPWLLKEKPAHLALRTTQHIVSYLGTNPDESFIKPRVILPGEVPLPKTLAEKKQYPRIFTGNVHLTKGEATIGLRRPKNSKLEVRVGCPLAVFGEVSINAKELTP